MKLVEADAPTLDKILEESHDIWSDGLSRRAYGRFNAAQMQTPWGSRNLRRFALLDEHGALLSSGKRYDLRARLDGHEVKVVGLGAVYTPSGMRGRGYARQLVEGLVAAGVRDGAELALLFADIEPAYYAAQGFVAVRRRELVITTKDMRGAPMVLVRTGEERDIPAVSALAAAMGDRHRFSLIPCADSIRYSLSRKRLLAGLLAPGLLSVGFFIVEEGAGAVAFAILTATSDDLILEMCGDRDPTGARVGALLQVLRARTPAGPPLRVECFLPPGWLPPQVEVVERGIVREVMMVRPLKDGLLEPPLTDADVLYWHGDLF